MAKHYILKMRDAQYGKWQSIRLIKEILLKLCYELKIIDVESFRFLRCIFFTIIEYI